MTKESLGALGQGQRAVECAGQLMSHARSLSRGCCLLCLPDLWLSMCVDCSYECCEGLFNEAGKPRP